MNNFSGFYKLNQLERIQKLKEGFNLSEEQSLLLLKDGALPHDLSDLFVENSLGNFPMPLGLVTNIQCNGEDFVVPFAVEESSVIAAASNAAKWARLSGGFQTENLQSLMIGQIQILDVLPENMNVVKTKILASKEALLLKANNIHPRLVIRGGGARDLDVRSFPDAEIPFMVVHIYMDTQEAMGANLINTVCEKLAPEIEQTSEARIGLKILSNYADRKLYRARCRISPDCLALKDADNPIDGNEVAKRIVEAYVFAKHDPYRATTHNKGIMNGVDPVVIATGNDWRAVESGVHTYAVQDGRYQSLSKWQIDEDGMLVGELTLPLQLGTVGGVTRLHPTSQLALQILGNPSVAKLGQIVVAAGLASNLAALRALVTTGIQAGHMKLHAKNVALSAGAQKNEIEVVASEMLKTKNVAVSEAEKILFALRQNGKLTQKNASTQEFLAGK